MWWRSFCYRLHLGNSPIVPSACFDHFFANVTCRAVRKLCCSPSDSQWILSMMLFFIHASLTNKGLEILDRLLCRVQRPDSALTPQNPCTCVILHLQPLIIFSFRIKCFNSFSPKPPAPPKVILSAIRDFFQNTSPSPKLYPTLYINILSLRVSSTQDREFVRVRDFPPGNFLG